MTKIEEIYEAVLPEMEANKIEDTTENRLIFLEGLYQGWKEDSDVSLEKALYQMALLSEIMRLRVRTTFPKIMK